MAKAAGDIAAMVQEGVGTAGDLLEAAEQKIYAIRQGRGGQDMATRGRACCNGCVWSSLAELTAEPASTAGPVHGPVRGGPEDQRA